MKIRCCWVFQWRTAFTVDSNSLIAVVKAHSVLASGKQALQKNKNKELDSSEAAFGLLTQLPWVQFSAFSSNFLIILLSLIDSRALLRASSKEPKAQKIDPMELWLVAYHLYKKLYNTTSNEAWSDTVTDLKAVSVSEPWPAAACSSLSPAQVLSWPNVALHQFYQCFKHFNGHEIGKCWLKFTCSN